MFCACSFIFSSWLGNLAPCCTFNNLRADEWRNCKVKCFIIYVKKSPVELVKNVVITKNYMAKPLKVVREQSEIKSLEAFVNPCGNVVLKMCAVVFIEKYMSSREKSRCKQSVINSLVCF